MENENEIPSLQHRLLTAQINDTFRNKHALSGSNPINNCLGSWGIWLVDELIQKQAIFCLSCGKFNFVNDLDTLPNRIVCNNPIVCLQNRSRIIED